MSNGYLKNRNKKTDNVSDVAVSYKHDTEADIGELFWSREAGKLSFKKAIGEFVRYEDNYVPPVPPAAPYKVFTALLTQNGGDNPDNISIGTLTIGVTYKIEDSSGNPDFTIVGAPNNLEGTSFIATGTTPNWGNDGAALSFNTGAPVATALENTIGNVWFTYGSEGNYLVNSNALFIENKSSIALGNVTWDGGSGTIRAGFDGSSVGIILTTLTDGVVASTGSLINTIIEIRVYE